MAVVVRGTLDGTWIAPAQEGTTARPGAAAVLVSVNLAGGAVYAPGDLVRGSVALHARRATRVRSVRVGLVRRDEYPPSPDVIQACAACSVVDCEPILTAAAATLTHETWVDAQRLAAGATLDRGEVQLHDIACRLPLDARTATAWRMEVHLDLPWARDVRCDVPLIVS